MKINKWTIIICVIMLTISGTLIYMISNTATKLFGLALGVFTGFLVSLVIAIVNYLHQKYLIYNAVKTQISDIFINTYILHRMTGMILDKVQNLNKLDDLNYRSPTQEEIALLQGKRYLVLVQTLLFTVN